MNYTFEDSSQGRPRREGQWAREELCVLSTQPERTVWAKPQGSQGARDAARRPAQLPGK